MGEGDAAALQHRLSYQAKSDKLTSKGDAMPRLSIASPVRDSASPAPTANMLHQPLIWWNHTIG
jgi:hypothetical protein